MPAVTCASCGTENETAPGVNGFKCKSCQRNNWIFACRSCHQALVFWRELPRTKGYLTIRCRNCGVANSFMNDRLRAIAAAARSAAGVRRAKTLQERQRATQDAQAHKAQRSQEAARLTAEATEAHALLRGFLSTSLDIPLAFTFASLRQQPPQWTFRPPLPAPHRSDDGPSPVPPEGRAPTLEDFLEPTRHGLVAALPGAERRRRRQREEAEQALAAATQAFNERQREYEEALQAHTSACIERSVDFDRRQAEYERRVEEARATFEKELAAANHAVATNNNTVDELEKRYADRDPQAVSEFLSECLRHLTWPFPSVSVRVAYSPDSSQAVIEIELPPFSIVPETTEFRYVASRDEIAKKAMPEKERRGLYSSLVAQIALRTVWETFRGDPAGVVATVVLNGHVTTIDPKTGHQVHPCLVTLRTTRDSFGEIELHNVDPGECLKGLKAALSRQPSELLPVKPVLEFDMVDPRFVKEADVLATLDDRPNLMELSPGEFESLVTNLFEKMGLQTRLTRPSRDGGVDCVAWDMRPILGGKVVIQAKRYKNTVGVSAVRDLYGTMQNERATKGILVTTSGYGTASFEFAGDKPMELLDGSNLLSLLKDLAGIDAKIEVPDDWVDPLPS